MIVLTRWTKIFSILEAAVGKWEDGFVLVKMLPLRVHLYSKVLFTNTNKHSSLLVHMTVLLPVSEINWISVENVMKTCRLYDALLAWRILLWGKVDVSIQLPIPCGLHELKLKQKCVCAYVSAPASVCDPQRLCNPVLLMLSRVLLSITESSNQSGGLEQLIEAGLSSQTDIVCPLSSCSVSDGVCVHVHLCVCSLGITGTFSVSRYSRVKMWSRETS